MELIARINNDDESAKNILLKKYSYYAKSLAFDLCNYYEHAFLMTDDLAAVALEQVMVALNYYDGKSNFYPYWYVIAEREMKKMIEKSYKHFTSISLDTTITDNGLSLHDIVGSEVEGLKNGTLYDTFIDILKDKRNDLTEMERTIIKHYLHGYSINEIAELLKSSRNKVYYLYKKALNKIRLIITSRK